MSPDALTSAWAKLRPGETLVYHSGLLGFAQKDDPDKEARAELSAAARDLYTAGVAELTQGRFGFEDYQYRATKRVMRTGPREWPLACSKGT